MDPVVASVISGIAVAIISGIALVRSSRSSSIATNTKTLVDGQQRALDRLDAQLSAKDSTLEDLRIKLDECHAARAVLEDEVARQGTALAAAQAAIERQAKELARLRRLVTERGYEGLP